MPGHGRRVWVVVLGVLLFLLGSITQITWCWFTSVFRALPGRRLDTEPLRRSNPAGHISDHQRSAPQGAGGPARYNSPPHPSTGGGRVSRASKAPRAHTPRSRGPRC